MDYGFLTKNNRTEHKKNILENCSVETFEEVMEFVGIIPHINDGGCGIAALSCYRWLEKYQPAELSSFSIVYMYYEEEGRPFGQNIERNTRRDYKDIWTPPHVAFRYRGILLEAGGGEIANSEFTLSHEVAQEFLIENLKYGAWNFEFSRNAWCPVIEKVLDISLQDVIKFQQRNEMEESWSELIGDLS